MKKVILSAAILCVLSACSTVEGMGQDIQLLGKGVSHVANEVRDEMFASSPTPTAKAGEPCDPYADELAGGDDLPPCQKIATGPGPRLR